MDGLKKRLGNSLQFRLSLTLSLAIIVVALIAGVFAYRSAFDEAHELQDDVLRQVATLLDGHGLTLPQTGSSGSAADSDTESRVFVQLLPNKQASQVNSTGAAPTVLQNPVAKNLAAQNLVEGLQTVRVGHESYRVLVRTIDGGQATDQATATQPKSAQRMAVAQATAVRDEAARDSAVNTLMPLLLLVPILLLLVSQLVRRLFKPIADASNAIDQRSEQELGAIATTALPAEVLPFVDAINRLLKRVEQSIEAQRRFVADAAHELRSPLTALSLQAERLAHAEMSSTAQERLATLRLGIERGRSLIDQLLELARAQANSNPNEKTNFSHVSIATVYRSVLEDLLPMAEAKRIDIGVVSGSLENPTVLANEMDLTILLKNLVDNAIRYTPMDGRVDLSVKATSDAVVLVIEDTGTGIPPEERTRVFDAFYRILGSDEIGSGLGLSIVQTLCQRMGATISLAYANEDAAASRADIQTSIEMGFRSKEVKQPTPLGLRVTISFPNTMLSKTTLLDAVP